MSKGKIQYQRLEDVEFVPKVFSEFVDDYIYNEISNRLVKSPTQKNVQSYIDSFADSALDIALDKFLSFDKESDEVAVVKNDIRDLSAMADVFDIAEGYREQFGLADDLTISQIFDFVGHKSDELAEKLKTIQNGGKVDVEKEEIEEKSK